MTWKWVSLWGIAPESCWSPQRTLPTAVKKSTCVLLVFSTPTFTKYWGCCITKTAIQMVQCLHLSKTCLSVSTESTGCENWGMLVWTGSKCCCCQAPAPLWGWCRRFAAPHFSDFTLCCACSAVLPSPTERGWNRERAAEAAGLGKVTYTQTGTSLPQGLTFLQLVKWITFSLCIVAHGVCAGRHTHCTWKWRQPIPTSVWVWDSVQMQH